MTITMPHMNETEQALLDLVLNKVSQAGPRSPDLEVTLLLRTVRAYALRDAANDLTKPIGKNPRPMDTAYANWLFDRADSIESGGL
jgi:hypothetical protein